MINYPNSSFTAYPLQTEWNPVKFTKITSDMVQLDSLNMNEAVDILLPLFKNGDLPKEKFLVFGSIARELLTGEGKAEFGDIDIVVAGIYDNAVRVFASALEKLGFSYQAYKDEEGEFFSVACNGKNFRIEIIDKEFGKKVFPHALVDQRHGIFKEAAWQEGLAIPCVPLDKLVSRKKTVSKNRDGIQAQVELKGDIDSFKPYFFK
jgi:hypothetical protein